MNLRRFNVKVSLPVYIVTLFATFIFGILSYYVPGFVFTPEQVLWAIVTILTLLGVDVTQTLLKVAVELHSLIVNLRGQGILAPKESPHTKD